MSCRPSTWTDREKRLVGALNHLMHKNHPLRPAACWGCRDIACWLAVPGYDGEFASPGGMCPP